MATGISLVGDSGASQRKCGYGMWRPNDAEKLYRNKGGSWEEFSKKDAEKT